MEEIVYLNPTSDTPILKTYLTVPFMPVMFLDVTKMLAFIILHWNAQFTRNFLLVVKLNGASPLRQIGRNRTESPFIFHNYWMFPRTRPLGGSILLCQESVALTNVTDINNSREIFCKKAAISLCRVLHFLWEVFCNSGLAVIRGFCELIGSNCLKWFYSMESSVA